MDKIIDVIVLAPHPDDEILGCFGAIKEHIKENDKIAVIYITDGEKCNPGISHENMRMLRKKETERVLTSLRIKRKYFLSLPDTNVKPTEKSIEKLAQIIVMEKPKVIYSPNMKEAHRDHKNTWRILRACFKKYTDSEFEVRFYEVWTPLDKFNLIINISNIINEKIRLIKYYASQSLTIKYDEAIISLNRYRGIMTGWGEYCEVYDCYSVKKGRIKRISGGSGYDFLS